MKQILLILWVAGIAAPRLAAAPNDAAFGRGPGGAQPGQQGSSEENARRMRQMQEQRMESLKETDPAAYEEQKKLMRRDEKINKIVGKSRAGELSEEEAVQTLFPLIKDRMRPEMDGMKDRIAQLEKLAASLKKDDRDHDAFIRRRVLEMLGKSRPEPDAMMGVFVRPQ